MTEDIPRKRFKRNIKERKKWMENTVGYIAYGIFVRFGKLRAYKQIL